MAARAYWQGHMRLSLVSFPIRLYPASVPARQIAFHQIDKKSGQRVRQQLVVPGEVARHLAAAVATEGAEPALCWALAAAGDSGSLLGGGGSAGSDSGAESGAG